MSVKTFSLFRKPASANPGIAGVAGRAPVAMHARANRSVCPPTSMVSEPVKPVLDGEPVYEDHPIAFKAKDNGHSIAADVRRLAAERDHLTVITHAFSIFSDISAYKETEARLQRLAKVEATERAKTCPAAAKGRVEVRAVPNYQGA